MDTDEEQVKRERRAYSGGRTREGDGYGHSKEQDKGKKDDEQKKEISEKRKESD